MRKTFWSLPKERFIIFLYHKIDGVSNPSYSSLFVSKEAFERQIEFLHRRSYTFLTSEDLVDFMGDNASVGKKAVLITFDDGYLDNLINAWPILQRYGARATVFLTTEFIGKSFYWNDQENTFLGREQIVKLYEQGMDFGSHTLSHPSLIRCTLEKVAYEVSSSKSRIEELLGESIDAFAYPYGSYNSNIREAVVRAGYKWAYTLHKGINTIETDPYALRRFRPTNSFLQFLFFVYFATSIERMRKLRKK